MRTRRTGKAAALLLALAGSVACDVTVPWRSGSAPRAPAVEVGLVGEGGFLVSWRLQAGVDDYELQVRGGGGVWETPPRGSAPPGTSPNEVTWWVGFGGAAELETTTARVRARAGSYHSAWVEVSAVRPLSAPTLTIAVASSPSSGIATGPVTVGWTNRSLVATDLIVERGAGQGSGPWTALSGTTLAAGSLVDHDLRDGESYLYRARVGGGGAWSANAIANAGPIVLAAPWGLEAEVVASGVALTWHAQSTTATSTFVYRSTSGDFSNPVAQLAGMPAAWLDPSPPWPATSYQVSVNRDFNRAYSDVTPLAPFTLAGPPALAASAVELPRANQLARAPDGSFLLLDTSGGVVYRPTASGYERHALVGPSGALGTPIGFAAPGIGADTTGAPHVVYKWWPVASGTPELVPLVHEAWNGTAWEAEILDSVALTSGEAMFAFTVAPGGALHVAYCGSGAGGIPTILHLVRQGGVTTSTIIDPETTTSFVTASVAIQSSGDGTVVLGRRVVASTANGSAILLSIRTPGGAWSLDPVPIGSAVVQEFALAPGPAGDVAVAYVRDLWGPTEEVRVIRRTGGAWAAPEVAFSRPWGGGASLGIVGLSATQDLSRIALLIRSSEPTTTSSWIAMRGPAGWSAVEVGPTPAPGWSGFGSSGLWAVYRSDPQSMTSTIRYSRFTDAP